MPLCYRSLVLCLLLTSLAAACGDDAPLPPPDVDGGSDSGVLDDPLLLSLVPSSGALSPAFAGATTTYTLGLPPGTTVVTLTPTVALPTHTTILVNGVLVTSGTPSTAIVLANGLAPTPVTVVVTTETGATRTYAVALLRGSAYVKASNTDASDQFSDSLALSADGSTLAVGAPYEASSATGIDGNPADNSAAGAGAVYVYTRVGSFWAQQAYIKASNTDALDVFGVSVALSADGSILAVGASGEASNATVVDGNQADNSAAHSGAVYVFTRTASLWSQQAYIKASNSQAGDNFGNAVALSADSSTLAVGAYNESSNARGVDGDPANNSASESGAVYVFSRAGSAWSQQAYVKASNTEYQDAFGSSVALSSDGSTLAVGAWHEDSYSIGINGDPADNRAADAGAVYVFTRAASVWSQQAYVKASNSSSIDYFGISVALSADGSSLAVGASQEDSNAISIGGNDEDDSASDAGAVYIFTRAASVWSQQAYVKASNTDVGDLFGTSVAFSSDGSTLAVGAPNEDSSAIGIDGNQATNAVSSAGAVYVFTGAGSTWSQQAYVKASNTDAEDAFGAVVALSSDGSALAVGAQLESSNATGVGGNQADNSAAHAGAVYVY